jgi:peroxiredoxin Q/BCP
MIAVGSPAPAFAVVDAHGKTVTERDLRGTWTVLYFYPRDDTPGCTTEACEFTASIADFEGLDAQVYGASPDTPAFHLKFIAKHALKVRLLSDPDHRLLTAYGAWGEKVLYGRKSIGVIRSTVIVDPAGVVAHRWAKVAAKGHAAFVRAKLVELRHAARPPSAAPTRAKKPASRKRT